MHKTPKVHVEAGELIYSCSIQTSDLFSKHEEYYFSYGPLEMDIIACFAE